MTIVKRTFSLPDDLSAEFDQAIPNQGRSKFVAQTLAAALQQHHQKNLLRAIDNIEPWQAQSESVVDTIRKIREAHPTTA